MSSLRAFGEHAARILASTFLVTVRLSFAMKSRISLRSWRAGGEIRYRLIAGSFFLPVPGVQLLALGKRLLHRALHHGLGMQGLRRSLPARPEGGSPESPLPLPVT